jgi:hypothetical protein
VLAVMDVYTRTSPLRRTSCSIWCVTALLVSPPCPPLIWTAAAAGDAAIIALLLMMSALLLLLLLPQREQNGRTTQTFLPRGVPSLWHQPAWSSWKAFGWR